jgi:hypothetical protein
MIGGDPSSKRIKQSDFTQHNVNPVWDCRAHGFADGSNLVKSSVPCTLTRD